jgi:alkanesulfonate monooxygenase SsuD/methylene tetrahydromethanopterin reductase-like flavin-dependent oxidoreductase (luciferase family)
VDEAIVGVDVSFAVGLMGSLGLPIFVGLGAALAPELAEALQDYRDAWHEAGHPGDGDIVLRLAIYVADTMEQALAEPEASATHHYERLRQAFLRASGAAEGKARAARAARLATLTYADVVRDRTAFGTPEVVAERLQTLRETLGLSGVIMEANLGGRIPPELLLHSISLFGQEVAPRLRAPVA